MSTKSMELTDLNVNNVLDEIRPYIEADGGYLEFVAIDYLKDGPIVMVRMLGACAGCAMSAQTMTMGIEKLLKIDFLKCRGFYQYESRRHYSY